MPRLNDETKAEILAAYRTPGHPVAFSAPAAVARHFRVSPDAVKKVLEEEDAYVLHREYKRPRVFNPYFIRHRRELVQGDLIDIADNDVIRANDGVRYLLVLIDVFSRKIWVYPLRSKRAPAVTEALRRWEDDIDDLPAAFASDHGMEFMAEEVKAWFRSHNVVPQAALGTSKACYAERVNKTLQILIYKYLTDQETLRYIDYLPELVRTYNDRPHRSLAYEFSPNQADLPENEETVAGIHDARYRRVTPKRPRFKVGDKVRVKTQAKSNISPDRRAYAEQFRGEYFTIEEVKTNLPIPMYILRSDDRGDVLQGSFYAEEIQRVRPVRYKIDTILARRRVRGRNMLKVKWKYFDQPEHVEWIYEDQLVDV